MYKATNNCASTLAAGLTDSGVTLTIQTADIARFPIINQGGTGTDYTYLTIQDAALNMEIVKVTRHDNGSSSLTIARAQEGTTARAWQTGDSVALRVTAGVVNDAFARAYDAMASEVAAEAAATSASQSLADINALATQVGASITDDGLITSMSNARQRRRGTTAEHATFTGLVGELTVDTTKKTVVVHDGVTAGGFPLARHEFVKGTLYKADPFTPLFTKTAGGSASVKANNIFEVNGKLVQTVSATSIIMPALNAGTDYALYVCDDGTFRADSNFSYPSGWTTTNSVKIGGFHYAPGGNATGQSGGNTTAQINEYSLWDMKFRPSCVDPRGMTLVADAFWSDIYLTGVDAITNGSSRYNVTIADGSSPPKIPSMFGGNGSTTYGSYTWFEACQLAAAFGKRLPTQREFMALAFGTTEAAQNGSDPGVTSLIAAFISKWGCHQVAGAIWQWGDDRGGAYNTGGWNANTEGFGSEYNAPNAVFFGGGWGDGSLCGSRSSGWHVAASVSYSTLGSRFCCDHLILS